MSDVHVLAIDLAKRSFQVCATARGGAVLFNRTLSRAKLMQMQHLGDDDEGAKLQDGVSGDLRWKDRGERLGTRKASARRSTDDLCRPRTSKFRMGKTSPGARASKLSEPMWPASLELHTGHVASATIKGLTHDR